MNIGLQEWANAQEPEDKMLWKGGYWDQVCFVRDKLAGLVGAGLKYEDAKKITTVISTHGSKSIGLPVYRLDRPDLGLSIILRNNFYNWKLSVISEKALEIDFDGIFHTTPPIEPDYTGNPLADCYFEGFPSDLIFSYYIQSDFKKFSAEIHGDYMLYTAIFFIMKNLGVVKAFQWSTKESHQKELSQ